MANNQNDTLQNLLAETKHVRSVFWGREIGGLGPAALQLLVAIHVAVNSGTETTASALAESIGIAAPAASTELKKLESGGLVNRTRGAGHHLSRDTQLTRAGIALVQEIEKKARAAGRD